MLAASAVFLLIWVFLILTPCALIAWLGYRFITKLGQYPSKTPVLQKNVMFYYLLIVIASTTTILVFFRVLTSEQ